MPVFAAAYVFVMSAAGFFVCRYDKRAAVRSSRKSRGESRGGRGRVSERSLFALALLGGAAGIFAAMLIFRHKTRHIAFMLLMPIIIVLQAAAIFAFKVF